LSVDHNQVLMLSAVSQVIRSTMNIMGYLYSGKIFETLFLSF